MIIVSQDNDKVIKRIINLDNIIYLSIDRPGENDFVIIFKDNTMNDNELTKYNCLLGVYKTEERAKEVLQEIIERYTNWNNLVYGQPTGICSPKYEMPKE